MRRHFRSWVSRVVVITAALALAPASAPPGPGPASAANGKPSAVPGELIVGFQPGVSVGEQQSVLARVGAKHKRGFAKIRASLVSVDPAALDEAIATLSHDRRVRYVEPNFVVSANDAAVTPNDPLLQQLWGLSNSGQVVNGSQGTADADIDAPEAWSVSTGTKSVAVAVIDTGVDFGHPDLGGSMVSSPVMWINPGENCPGCRTNNIDDDGDGYVDDWRGWDFANGDNNPVDDHGHGTHVAGTIGARGNNGIGVVGVNWDVTIMALKFLKSDGTGTVADAVSAILYAAAHGASVMNNSWGGPDSSQALLDAIGAADSQNSLFVAAAGNSSTDTDQKPNYPSSYSVPNVISVAATDNRDARAWFSNYGRTSVDLGAPGTNIYSTWLGGAYQYLDGTSMATPQVAGAAALLKAAFPAATAAGLKGLLLSSVDPVPSLAGVTTSGGRLNVSNAIHCTDTPTIWLDSPAGGFNGYVGEPVRLNAVAALCAVPGSVAVTATANGNPLALTARGDGLYTASYTPTDAGSLSISISATSGAASVTRTVAGTVAPLYAITPGGAPVTVATTVPGQNVKLSFDGVAGRQVSLLLSGVTIGSSCCSGTVVSIVKPDGTTLASISVGKNGGFIDPKLLSLGGPYSIAVDPGGSATGQMTLTLYDVPPDLTGTITPGGAPVTIATTVPGQNAKLSFDGVAGRQVSVLLSGVTIGSSCCSGIVVSIVKPDGTTLTSISVGKNGGFIDRKLLPLAGPYAIVVDPGGSATGQMTLTLYDVPPDLIGTITPGGAPVTIATTVPGQNAKLSFDGVTGRQVSLLLSGVTIGSSCCSGIVVSIVKPDGTTLASISVGKNGGFIDRKLLSLSGPYTIVVDPGTATGQMTLTLYDVLPDVTGTITPGGVPVTIATTIPGQNAKLSFDGGAGRQVSLLLSGVTIGSSCCSESAVSIVKPDGTTLASMNVGKNGGFIDPKLLLLGGPYTIVVDPGGSATGQMTLTLYDVPPDPTGTITLGGAPVTMATTVPGQNAKLSFDGAAGQQVSLLLSAVTIGSSCCSGIVVSIVKPDGTTLALKSIGRNGGVFGAQLSVAGTYAIVVNPAGPVTGSITLTLS
jgi:subtilisin family serine protease